MIDCKKCKQIMMGNRLLQSGIKFLFEELVENKFPEKEILKKMNENQNGFYIGESNHGGIHKLYLKITDKPTILKGEVGGMERAHKNFNTGSLILHSGYCKTENGIDYYSLAQITAAAPWHNDIIEAVATLAKDEVLLILNGITKPETRKTETEGEKWKEMLFQEAKKYAWYTLANRGTKAGEWESVSKVYALKYIDMWMEIPEETKAKVIDLYICKKDLSNINLIEAYALMIWDELQPEASLILTPKKTDFIDGFPNYRHFNPMRGYTPTKLEWVPTPKKKKLLTFRT